MPGNIYIITGPSGVGKTTVAYELLKRRPTLKKVVTCTTRPIRPNETDGVDYHFISKEEFARLKEGGLLFESAHHYDNDYGSRTADVEALMNEGFDVLFVIDVVGAQTIKREHLETIIIFIAPSSEDELFARLAKRGESAGLDERHAAIRREMEFTAQADHVIENRDGHLDETVEAVDRLIDTNKKAEA